MKLHRRTFLRATGVSLALPMLESMAAKPQVSPKRAVFICNTLSFYGPALYPKTTGENYEETPYLRILKEHRQDLTLFSGLSHPDQGGEHLCEATWLSAARNPGRDGFRNSISVDQFMARNLGNVTRFPSISMSSDGPTSQSYTSSGVMIPAEWRPSRLFERLFLQGNAKEVAWLRNRMSEGRSILDELMGQAKSVAANAPAGDRDRLNAYFESVREAEKEIAASEAWLDKPKPKVAAEKPEDIEDRNDLVGRFRLLLSLVPLIVETDSSRVISIVVQANHGVPPIAGVESEHHNLSHHGRVQERIDQLVKIESALLSSFGDLLGQLKSKSELDGSLLDHTMALFGSNLGNAAAHDPRNLPILLAGGDFQHGRYVAHDAEQNTPLCNLFARMLEPMGIESDQFGSGTGVLNW